MSRSYDALAPYLSQAIGLSPEELLQAYRPAVETDLPRILALRRAVNGPMWWDDEAFVRWRYFGPRTHAGTRPYWVFAKGEEIIGACGLEAVVLTIDGSTVPAVRCLDIMVRPDLDGLGLGAFMNLMLFKHFPITIVTGSNECSHQLLCRMFQHTVNLQFWKHLIETRAIIETRFKVRWLSSVIARVADIMLAAVRRRRRVATPAGVALREMSRFDDTVTNLSKRCERPGRVMVRRSAEYLNWRFVENPRCRCRLFGAFNGGRLEAYVVTRLNLDRPNPRHEGEIVDWLVAPAADEQTSPLPALIQFGLDELVRSGARLVSCAAYGTDVERAMEATRFRFRPGERLPFFVRASSPSDHERLSSGQGWFLTRGDYDIE